jgi:hypothetical protein
MNPMPALIPMLKEIRLSGILDSLEVRNRQAIEEKLAYTYFLALLLQDEVARRAHKKFAPAILWCISGVIAGLYAVIRNYVDFSQAGLGIIWDGVVAVALLIFYPWRKASNQ